MPVMIILSDEIQAVNENFSTPCGPLQQLNADLIPDCHISRINRFKNFEENVDK
jgi:hypothetical protein